MENWEKNIQTILGEDTERSDVNAIRYHAHLKTALLLPITVTGREDFPWEEPYVFGGWSKSEYVKLKKTKPSYTDIFELINIQPPTDDDDLLATIVRKSDKKKFTIGLYWLTTETRKTPGFRELDDYATWHVNY